MIGGVIYAKVVSRKPGAVQFQCGEPGSRAQAVIDSTIKTIPIWMLDVSRTSGSPNTGALGLGDGAVTHREGMRYVFIEVQRLLAGGHPGRDRVQEE
jgi:hypothetical protein